MPYKDPADRREWNRRALERGVGREYLEAAGWADGQIALLRSMGIRHTVIEWRKIRIELVKSRLNPSTARALYAPPHSDPSSP